MFNFLPLITYSAVMSFTPGPNNVICLALGTRYGFKTALKYVMGVTIGCLSLTLIGIYANYYLFKILPVIKTYLGIAGAFYMIYLAVKIILSGRKSKIETKKEQKPLGTLTGITLQLVNPKALIYVLTLSSTFVLPYTSAHWVILAVGLISGAMAFLATASWSLFGSIFQKFLEKYAVIVNTIMGGILIYLAFSILWSGFIQSM